METLVLESFSINFTKSFSELNCKKSSLQLYNNNLKSKFISLILKKSFSENKTIPTDITEKKDI